MRSLIEIDGVPPDPPAGTRLLTTVLP